MYWKTMLRGRTFSFSTWGITLMALGLLSLSIGCGGGGAPKQADEGMTDDQKAISDVVGSVADYSGNVARLRELFTRDAAPSATDGKKYGDYMYNVEGTINVSGDTATFDVSIVPSADENPTPVKKTWKAVKEGGKWKLSEAPLP